MTNIPDITDGVSLTELLRGVSRSSREREDREDEFVKDLTDVEESARADSFSDLNKNQSRLNRERANEVSFVERARQVAEADTVTQLIRGLSRLDIEPPERTGEPARLPDRDLGAASFAREENRSLEVADRFRERSEDARRLGDASEDFTRESSEITERFGDARRSVFADRLNTQQSAVNERTGLFIEGSREVDAAFTATRNADVAEGFDVRDGEVASRDDLERGLAFSEGERVVAGVSRENEEQSRLGALESALTDLIDDESESFDSFVESRQNQRLTEITDVFGGSAIERAVASREASTSLRLLDEQEALAVLRNQPNAVVVGSNVVEGVSDDGRVTEIRLEEDNALLNPGQDLFFDQEAQRTLGNILNGRS